MNIVNKRWRHFGRFAKDVGVEGSHLAGMISHARVGDTFEFGKMRLSVQKKVHDKHGKLYTLSLRDSDGSLLRRGPVYIHRPSDRRLLVEGFTHIMLMGAAVASVAFVAVFAADLGGILEQGQSCKIAAFEVWKTGPDTGFMRIVTQNDIRSTSSMALEFPTDVTIRLANMNATPASFGINNMTAQMISTMTMNSGESVLVRAEFRDDATHDILASCTRTAEIRG